MKSGLLLYCCIIGTMVIVAGVCKDCFMGISEDVPHDKIRDDKYMNEVMGRLWRWKYLHNCSGKSAHAWCEI